MELQILTLQSLSKSSLSLILYESYIKLSKHRLAKQDCRRANRILWHLLAPTGVPDVTMYHQRSGTNVLPSEKVVRSSSNHLCHEEPMETLKCDWCEEEFSCKEELSMQDLPCGLPKFTQLNRTNGTHVHLANPATPADYCKIFWASFSISAIKTSAVVGGPFIGAQLHATCTFYETHRSKRKITMQLISLGGL